MPLGKRSIRKNVTNNLNTLSQASSQWDVVVVGAGIAGSSVACSLGRQGRKVLVVERDLSEPDRIVGELLQPGGVQALKELGLEHTVDHIDAQEVYGYAIFRDGKTTCIKYPVEDFDQTSSSLATEQQQVEGMMGTMNKKLAGRSFHNGRFVQRLREAAQAEENVTMVEGTVRHLINADNDVWHEGNGQICGVSYKPKPPKSAGAGADADDDEAGSSSGSFLESVVAKADLTVVCDGMYSTLRKSLVPDPKIELPSFFVGLLLHDCVLPYPNHGHVVLADPSPILFYPISSTQTRCLMDIRAKRLPSVARGDLAKYLTEKVAPQVPAQLRGPFLKAVEEGRVRSMQNKLMPAEVFVQQGALMLGDAFNMRHPLTGGGMTVALHDSKLLCDMLRSLGSFKDKPTTTEATCAFHTRRKPWATTINTLANALYKVFCRTGEEWNEEMQSACFDYLSLGGVYSTGPISLLGGLNPRPFVLVAHFFMVALYGIGRLLKPFPTPRGVLIGAQLLLGACAIILPIIRAEGIVSVFAPFLKRKPKVSSNNTSSSYPRQQATKKTT
jgi:squalene monooxygenase